MSVPDDIPQSLANAAVPLFAHKVLIIEDDKELASMVLEFLADYGVDGAWAGDGRLLSERLEKEHFDAVILDVGLPYLDGFEICRTIRPMFQGPIIILTARGREIDEVIALEVGADDYMAKPFRPHALLARLRIHLSRLGDKANPTSTDEHSLITVGRLVIDQACREVHLSGELIVLSTAEFDLLVALAQAAGKVVPREKIYEQLNGIKFNGMDRSIDLRISRLRKKLGDDPQQPTLIKSVRGVGYILAMRA